MGYGVFRFYFVQLRGEDGKPIVSVVETFPERSRFQYDHTEELRRQASGVCVNIRGVRRFPDHLFELLPVNHSLVDKRRLHCAFRHSELLCCRGNVVGRWRIRPNVVEEITKRAQQALCKGPLGFLADRFG